MPFLRNRTKGVGRGGLFFQPAVQNRIFVVANPIFGFLGCFQASDALTRGCVPRAMTFSLPLALRILSSGSFPKVICLTIQGVHQSGLGADTPKDIPDFFWITMDVVGQYETTVLDY